MDNPFFLALGDQGSSLHEHANTALEPFRHYLSNAIDALTSKEVSCRWKRLHDQQWQAELPWRVYRVSPWTDIELAMPEQGWFALERDLEEDAPLESSFVPEFDDPVIIGKGVDRQNILVDESDIRRQGDQVHIHLGLQTDLDRISWSGYLLSVRALNTSLDEHLQLYIDGTPLTAKHLGESRYRVEGIFNADAQMICDQQVLRFRILRAFSPAQLGSSDRFIREGGSYLLFAQQEPKNITAHIRDETHKWLNQLGVAHLHADGCMLDDRHWQIESVKEGKHPLLVLTAQNGESQQLPSTLELGRLPSVSFVCQPLESADLWIQLIENDDPTSDQQGAGLSELEHFFGENIRIQNGNAKPFEDGYRIIKSRPDERQLLLGEKHQKGRNRTTVLPLHEHLKVRVDTSQLKKQKYAIQNLKARPALAHEPLVRLFQDRGKVSWECFAPIPENRIDWKVLTNPEFDGCDRQREFVCKALASPDFAILDGPPGTGKTTTILELIIQLVRQGQRVLLSASTHAAINNVLERVKENSLENEIFALRIGDENRATGVEDLQYDNQLKSTRQLAGVEVSEQLLVDASNLVCGTTMGILRLFNNRALQLTNGEPAFDVLIIDECSKTTFQEFLVPALFARRWVLVGDERQLSPFTDREQITVNLDKLLLRPKQGKSSAVLLDPAVQEACFYLQELYPYKDRLVLPVSASVLRALFDELSHRNSPDLERILLVGKPRLNQPDNACWVTPTQLLSTPWVLYARDLLFIDQDLLEELRTCLPDDAIVMESQWPGTSHAFRHRQKWSESHSFQFRGRERLNDGFDIHRKLLERLRSTGWSEEVCWRLERQHWLRFLKQSKQSKTRYLDEQLDRLFPKSVVADGRIHILKNIAFPSVLEALAGSGLVKRKKDEPNTLNQGFLPHEKRCRHSTLTYQHRMHPDISRFPREQFYSHDQRNRSLEDGRFVRDARDWSYNAYPSRSHWLNVEGRVAKNRNQDEVKAVVKALKHFCQWASEQDRSYDTAVLTFYKAQESALREDLQKLTKTKAYSRFEYLGVSIKLATVDYFQGQEADLVILSMVNTQRDGFMDSPNRLNVSITRARYQLLIVGHRHYFAKRSRTEELNALADHGLLEGKPE